MKKDMFNLDFKVTVSAANDATNEIRLSYGCPKEKIRLSYGCPQA